MINFFKDLYNFFLLSCLKNNLGFFCENENIYEYLKPYILNKSKKVNVTLISFNYLRHNNKNVSQFVFKTTLIRQLVFLTLNLKYLYSSTPDLDKNIFKRSKTSNCKYIYLQHSMASITMIYNKGAFNNFDAIQAVTNYQFNEINEIKKTNKLKLRAFKSNYLFLKNKINTIDKRSYKDVLIAPSWNTNFYDLKLHIILNNFFKKNKISFDFRPHPMSLVKKEISLKELNDLNISCNLNYDLNFKKYNFLISDWSGIFIEFFLITKKKALLINTPQKILNNEYEKYSTKPAEIILRKSLAKDYDINNVSSLNQDILKQLKNDQIISSINKSFEIYSVNNFYFIFN